MLLVRLETYSLIQRFTDPYKEQIYSRPPKNFFRISSWETDSVILPVRSARYRDRNLKFIAKNSAPFEWKIETIFWIKFSSCRSENTPSISSFTLKISTFFSCNIFDNGNKIAEVCRLMTCTDTKNDVLQMELINCDALAATSTCTIRLVWTSSKVL